MMVSAAPRLKLRFARVVCRENVTSTMQFLLHVAYSGIFMSSWTLTDASSTDPSSSSQ